MHITNTMARPNRAPARQNSHSQAESHAAPDNGLSVKDSISIGTSAVAGGALGAVPFLGIIPNLMAAMTDDQLAGRSGIFGAATNLCASFAVLGEGVNPAWMALPGVLGGIAWAANTHAEVAN